jgi:capsular polysaccharide transport system permease protein
MSEGVFPSGVRRPSLFRSLDTQMSVIGAVMMRELHTRYGRENIGYLWLIGEPLMLGTVIGLVHLAMPSHDNGFNPVTFTIVGYTLFIMFRGIIGRSEGTLLSNQPLLYHRMVSVLDITVGRALLEAAGTFVSFLILYSILMVAGFAEFPTRPLMLLAGIACVFWFSLSISMIIVGGTYENRLLERLTHPFSYFMIPLSGAFFRAAWIPEPFRHYLLFNPFLQIFELIRYGVFQNATLEYVSFTYIVGSCMVLTVLGLIALKAVKRRIHLS